MSDDHDRAAFYPGVKCLEVFPWLLPLMETVQQDQETFCISIWSDEIGNGIGIPISIGGGGGSKEIESKSEVILVVAANFTIFPVSFYM